MKLLKNLLKKKSWRIVLMFMVAALLIIWVTDTPTPQKLQLDNSLIEDTGYISLIFADSESGETGHSLKVYFTESDGDMFPIETNSPMQYLEYNGDYVDLDYSYINTDNNEPLDDALVVQDIDTLRDDMQNGVTGNTQWVNIACRFADMKDTTPKPMDYFQDMMVNVEPGMDHYWRATSADVVNIEGSGAFGWYNLPDDKNTYTRMAALNTGNALRKLMNDCVEQAIKNDNVDFTKFGGINMMLNDTFGCCAWGGRMGVNVNGQTIQYRTTWLPPWAYDSLHVIAHEMGHGWGLPTHPGHMAKFMIVHGMS